MKTNLLLIGFIAIMSFAFTGLSAQKVGEKAPDFSYTDLAGTTHTLATYSGKVLFIFSFGNGCPNCKESGPETQSKIQQVYGSRTDFKAIGLDTWDNTSSTSTVGAFKSTTGITYPLCIKAGSFESLYSTTYDRAHVIDQNGILRYKGSKQVKTDINNVVAAINGLFTSTDIPGVEEGFEEGLAPVYPNPSRDRASVKFNMASDGKIDVRMFNPLGQEVRKIVNGDLPAGEHIREFSVSELSAGIYFIRMNTPDASYIQKMQVSH